MVGVILLVVALWAVFGRSILPGDGEDILSRSGSGETVVKGVIGSEKRDFFEDPDVVKRLSKLGYTVEFTTAGSREIADDADLKNKDFALPSSAPAAQKIRDNLSGSSVNYPFFSPMAVATFQPIVEILQREGVVEQANGGYILNVDKYIDLARSNKRWRDLGSEFPSPRKVQISTTNIKSSNSAAMYLSILAWQFQQREPEKADDVAWLTDQITPFFTGQGYTESSSAGPFADYLSQGMGSAPMVMVYEAQFFGEQLKDKSRIKDDMVLVQLDPTVLAKHGLVGISDEGKNFGKLLEEDEELQKLAARHGFRTTSGNYLDEVMEKRGLSAPPNLVNSVDPPNFDRLEKLIEGVIARYGKLPDGPLE
ncbi:hypothetical protein KIP68_01300 [Corynebacterium aquatimens]